jgi:thymidylate kinase
MRCNSVKVVSFSGIDGAGKSTQIEALCRHLQESGFHFALYTFWDDVVVLGKSREHMSLKAFKGDKGVGSPANPITRRDKNVTSWYLTAMRLFLYLLDAFHLGIVVSRRADSGVDFVIFDRYIYDELANLPLQNAAVRLYIRLLLRFVPRPDLAILVDADPEAATLRKPEYPLEFVRRNRDAYIRLSRVVRGITVVPPQPVEQTSETIKELVGDKCLRMEVESLDFRVQCPAAPESAKTSNS